MTEEKQPPFTKEEIQRILKTIHGASDRALLAYIALSKLMDDFHRKGGLSKEKFLTDTLGAIEEVDRNQGRQTRTEKDD